MFINTGNGIDDVDTEELVLTRLRQKKNEREGGRGVGELEGKGLSLKEEEEEQKEDAEEEYVDDEELVLKRPGSEGVEEEVSLKEEGEEAQ